MKSNRITRPNCVLTPAHLATQSQRFGRAQPARKYRTQSVVGAFVLAIISTTASAQYYTFGWTDYLDHPYGGGGPYKSYMAALKGARAFSPAWKWLQPIFDPLSLGSKPLPWEGNYSGACIPGTNPTALCSAQAVCLTQQQTNGCTFASSGIQPWVNDGYTCPGSITCPPPNGGTGSTNLGALQPVCLEPAYSYVPSGTQPQDLIDNYRYYSFPTRSCHNPHFGSISSNIDPGKCNVTCPMGNPVNPALGIKTHRETVFQTPSLRFEMLYSSNMDETAIKRAGWSHNYSSRLAMAAQNAGPVSTAGDVWMYRADGAITKFRLSSGTYAPDPDIADRLTRLVDANNNTSTFVFQAADSDDVETYDNYGNLLSIRRRGGDVATFTYSDAATPTTIAPWPGLLITSTDAVGRHADLKYNAQGRLTSVSDMATNLYSFGYDSAGNLSAITYPGVPAATRTFVYENAAFPNALTGIVDENNQRFSTYSYDGDGRATNTQHAGGVESYSFVFNADGSSTITDPLGFTRNFAFTIVQNAVKGAGIDQPCTTCGDGAQAKTYDSNGNVTSRSDFTGHKRCYGYDTTRNLETARVEGVLTGETCSTVLGTLPNRPDVRKVSTQWHATWRAPLKVAEPSRLTTYVYNGDGGVYCAPTTALVNGVPIGVPCSKQIDETLDTTGQQGLGATLKGTPARKWQYTYDSFGQVLTAKDPNNKTTTYAYYPTTDPDLGKRGNLQSVTNPLGHLTQYTAYDGNGRPLAITDPNGVVSTLTYHPRGWLASRSVGGEATSYAYDGVGQLSKVTQPDGSYVQYTYDAAHRLTGLQDSLNNTITYTLDNLGNRIKEEVKDPNSNLARLRQRVFDNLNRLHQNVDGY